MGLARSPRMGTGIKTVGDMACANVHSVPFVVIVTAEMVAFKNTSRLAVDTPSSLSQSDVVDSRSSTLLMFLPLLMKILVHVS